MATKKKTAAIIAAIGAVIGALFFWRKRKDRARRRSRGGARQRAAHADAGRSRNEPAQPAQP